MKRRTPALVSASVLFMALLVPQPASALGGSEAFWGTIIGIFIVSFFVVLAVVPWLSYRLIKGRRMVWIVITLALCAVGLYYSTLICGEIFGDPEWLGQRILINFFAGFPYAIILLLTIQKLSAEKEHVETIQQHAVQTETGKPQNDHPQAAADPEEAFVTYQEFRSEAEANTLASLLVEHNIEYLMEDHSPAFDIIFSTSVHERELWIKLDRRDFETADRIYAAYLNSFIESIDKAYYLFGFSEQELLQVINQRNEWSKLDVLLAQKILTDRGATNSELAQETIPIE